MNEKRRTLAAAIEQHMRVINALMLRDIKTRFGATYFGFFLGLLLPLGHIGAILLAYILMGRRSPIGTDVAVYLGTAIVPFVTWSYTHQRVLSSVIQNKALTSFSIVNYIDIIFARSLVELQNSVLIILIVTFSYELAGIEIYAHDISSVVFALLAAYMLGVATGSCFSLMSILFPSLSIVGFILVPIYWISSGVFFIPDSLPDKFRDILWLFPLSHIVDFLRISYYANYTSYYPDIFYVNAIIIINLLITLTVERFLRPALTSR